MSNMQNKVLILRSTFGKGMEYHIEPCRDSRGNWPDCVRQVDSKGDVIMTRKDVEEGLDANHIKVTDVFSFKDGSTLDLSIPYEANIWTAVKNSPLIIEDRWRKTTQGELIINSSNAVLYVEEVEREAERVVSKKELKFKAERYVFEKPIGELRKICKVLGSDLSNVSENEVKEFILSIVEKNPRKVINLFESEDTSYRILLLEARAQRIITVRDGLSYFQEVLLGGSDDAVVLYLKDSKNKTIYNLILKEVYPELA